MEENNKLKMIKTILNNMKEDHIGESAAQCAYYVILSFIPFTILLLTLIQYTNVEPQQLFDIISNIIPSYMNERVFRSNKRGIFKIHRNCAYIINLYAICIR